MENIPHDLLYEVFSFCSPSFITQVLALVCNDWNYVSRTEALWRPFIGNIPCQYDEKDRKINIENLIEHEKYLFFKWRIHNQQLLHKFILNTIDPDLHPIFDTKEVLSWECRWRVTIVDDDYMTYNILDSNVIPQQIHVLKAYLLNFEHQNVTQDRTELQIILTDTQYLEFKDKLIPSTDLCDFFVVEGQATFSPSSFIQKSSALRFKPVISIRVYDICTIEDVETKVRHNLIDGRSINHARSYDEMKQQWLTYAHNITSPVEFDRFKYHQYFVGTLVYCDAKISSVDRDNGKYSVTLVTNDKSNEEKEIVPPRYDGSIWRSCKDSVISVFDYLLLNKSFLPDLYTMLNNYKITGSYQQSREPRTLTLFSSNVHQNKELHHHYFVYSNKYMNRMFDEGDTVRILARFVTVDKLIVYEMSLRGTSGPCYRKAVWDSTVVLFAISIFMMRYGKELYNVKKLTKSMWSDFDKYIASGINVMMGLTLELERKEECDEENNTDDIIDYYDDDSLSQLISKLILALIMRAIGNFVLKIVKWIWRILVVPGSNMERDQGIALLYVFKYSMACGLMGYAWVKSRSKLMQHVYSIMLYFAFKRNLRKHNSNRYQQTDHSSK